MQCEAILLVQLPDANSAQLKFQGLGHVPSEHVLSKLKAQGIGHIISNVGNWRGVWLMELKLWVDCLKS